MGNKYVFSDVARLKYGTPHNARRNLSTVPKYLVIASDGSCLEHRRRGYPAGRRSPIRRIVAGYSGETYVTATSVVTTKTRV